MAAKAVKNIHEKVVWSLAETCSHVSLSKTSIYFLEKSGDFPKRIQLGARRIGFFREEVEAWLRQKQENPERSKKILPSASSSAKGGQNE